MPDDLNDAGRGAGALDEFISITGISMHNPYAVPAASLDDVGLDYENNSGEGSGSKPPSGVTGWSWGAFMWGWIWAIGNRTWIGLLALIPYVGFFVHIYLGVKGRELAWQNRRWDSLEHFNRVQRRWSIWALVILGGIAVLGMMAAIALPAYTDYLHRVHGM
jgi:hypothetical protein